MYRRAILGIGYLPQETSIFRGMTVEQNIACVLELGRARRGGARPTSSSGCSRKFHLTRLPRSAAMALSAESGGAAKSPAALAANPSIMAARRALRRDRPSLDRRHPRPGEGP
jgi:lipopolysaccharide export system ATP-binding protein